MKEAKRKYYTIKINDSAGDNKNMWQMLKVLLPFKKSNVTTLPDTSENDIQLANEFNEHFTNIDGEPGEDHHSSCVED